MEGRIVEIVFNKIKLLSEFDEYLACQDGRDEGYLKFLKEILLEFLTREDVLKAFNTYPSLSPKSPGKVLNGVLERCIEFNEFGIRNQRYYDLRPKPYCGKRKYSILRQKTYCCYVKRPRYNLRSK